jgi:bifunctional UDP-N-acetylglucosamine pyrophosphorylase/glucosamine-1-phosphate N-acetyltransferase
VNLHVVVLAAGRGTRMKSSLPKVLHPLAGRPMLFHVLDAALGLSPEAVTVVIGHEPDAVTSACCLHYPQQSLQFVHQSEQLGTAHAVAQALPLVTSKQTVIILYGDVPLISKATLSRLSNLTSNNALALLTAQVETPKGYGRICRDTHGCVTRIVEEKDADEQTRSIQEVNSGIIAIQGQVLLDYIPKIDNSNAQREFYLTDLVGLCVKNNLNVVTTAPKVNQEILGVNDRQQLATLERYFQLQQANELMQQGLALLDPHRFDLRGDLNFGEDVMIDVNVVLEGNVRIGNNVFIGPHCVLKNVTIEDGAIIHSFSHLEKARVGRRSQIGPYARLRPGTELAAEVHVGNFVEIKNSRIANNTKMNHLSYIGDAEIGEHTNIGAGTITCNYDGANKHVTRVGHHVFIGSNSALVAPISIGDYATVGAGSTLSKDAPAQSLTLARAKQMSFDDWVSPQQRAAANLSSAGSQSTV